MLPSPLRRSPVRAALLGVLASAVVAAVALGGESKGDLQKALDDGAIVGEWNYDDIGAGFARAVREKKPVCIVFR